VVEHGDVLGDAQRIVEGEQQRGDADPDLLGPTEDEPGHDQG
jgi:hypothetical protein